MVKNKLAPPFREVEFDILYGQGISRTGDIVDLASEMGIIEKSGAWFSFGGERIGQGRENAKAFLEQHPDITDKIEATILAKHGIKRSVVPGCGRAAERRSRREGHRPEEGGASHDKPATNKPSGHAASGAAKKPPSEASSRQPRHHKRLF